MNFDSSSSDPVPQELDAPRNHVWKARDIAYFAMTFIGLTAVSAAVAPSLTYEGAGGEAATALAQTLFIELGLVAVIVFLIRRTYGLNLATEIRWNTRYSMSNATLVVLGMGLAFAVMVSALLFPPSDTPIEELIDSPQAVVLFAAYGGLIAPAVEEFIFRGFLFRVFEALGGAGVAVRVTALLFGLLHVPQLWGSWAGILVIFVVGFVLSEVRRRADSVVPSMIVHFSYNGLILIAGLAGSLAGGEIPADPA